MKKSFLAFFLFLAMVLSSGGYARAYNLQLWYVQHRIYEDGRDFNRFSFAVSDDSNNYVLEEDAVQSATLFGPDGTAIQTTELNFYHSQTLNAWFDWNKQQYIYPDPPSFPSETGYSADFEGIIQPGIYHLQVKTKDDIVHDLYYTFKGLVTLPIIPSSSLKLYSDSKGALICQWDTPNNLPAVPTSVRVLLDAYTDKLATATVSVSTPPSVGILYVPPEVINTLKSLGDRFTVTLQLRTTGDYNNSNRTYSRSLNISWEQLPKLSRISGRVLQVDRVAPIGGATINAQPMSNVSMNKYSTTASDGSYSMELSPGEYRIQISAPGYAREFYDNTPLSHQAKNLTISQGENINLDFDLTEGGAISGFVYESATNNPVVGGNVSIHPSGYVNDVRFWTKTGTDGSYTVTGLALGNYNIEIQAGGFAREYYGGVYTYWSDPKPKDVKVYPPKTTSGIGIYLEKEVLISGNILDQQGNPMPSVHVTASGTLVSAIQGATADQSGQYTIRGLPPGDYTLNIHSPSLPFGYAPESYNNAYKDSDATTVRVSEGQEVSGIDFRLDPGGAVCGRVYDAATLKPLSNISIVAELIENGQLHSISSGEQTDAYGNYCLELGPWPHAIGIAWWDTSNYLGYMPEFYNNISGIYEPWNNPQFVTPVEVKAGEKIQGIDFGLERQGSISGTVLENDGVTPVAGASLYAFPIDPPNLAYSSSPPFLPAAGYNCGALNVSWPEPNKISASIIDPLTGELKSITFPHETGSVLAPCQDGVFMSYSGSTGYAGFYDLKDHVWRETSFQFEAGSLAPLGSGIIGYSSGLYYAALIYDIVTGKWINTDLIPKTAWPIGPIPSCSGVVVSAESDTLSGTVYDPALQSWKGTSIPYASGSLIGQGCTGSGLLGAYAPTGELQVGAYDIGDHEWHITSISGGEFLLACGDQVVARKGEDDHLLRYDPSMHDWQSVRFEGGLLQTDCSKIPRIPILTKAPAGGGANSDPSGSYTIQGLLSGRYVVAAIASGHVLSSREVAVKHMQQTANVGFNLDRYPYTVWTIGQSVVGISGGNVAVSDTSSDLFNAGIVVPPNALPSNTVLTIGGVEAPDFPEEIIGVGSPVHFGPEGTVFSSPVTIKIPYTQEALAAAGVQDPNLLDVYTYNTSKSLWELVEGSKTVDTEKKIVLIQVSHFSMFRLGVKKVAPPVVPGDFDDDGDVDRNDINIIKTHLNQTAAACPECDIDGDGKITVLDARKLVLMCTCPNCLCQ